MRERAEHWDRSSGEFSKRLEVVEEAARRVSAEVVDRTDGEIQRLKAEMGETEKVLCDQVRNGLHIIRDIEGKLTREVHSKLDTLAENLKGLEEESRKQNSAPGHPLLELAQQDADQILARLAKLEERSRESALRASATSRVVAVDGDQAEPQIAPSVVAVLRGEGDSRHFAHGGGSRRGGATSGSSASDGSSYGPDSARSSRSPPVDRKEYAEAGGDRGRAREGYAEAIDKNKERRRRRLKELYKELSSLESEEKTMAQTGS